MSTWRYRVLSLALTVLALCAPCEPAAAADVRQEFIVAMQRLKLHQPDVPDSQALQQYAIYDYLVAGRLRRDAIVKPDAGLDALIDAFLQEHAGQPVTKALRREWLTSLAVRRRWDLFLARSGDAVDPALACDRLQARLASADTAGLEAAALARWLLPQKPPLECAAVFVWLRERGVLTAALAESRTRAALANGSTRLARDFAHDVPIERRTALLQWSDLLEAPRAALSVLAAHPAFPVEADALAAGFDRLCHTEPAFALELLPRLLERDAMTPVLRSQIKRAAALGAAYDHDPRALAAFEAVDVAALDAAAQEWRARTALWRGDYAKALQWISQMPTSLAVQPRWRYWHARARAALEGQAAAAVEYAEIAGLRDYYGYLAADRLQRPYDLNIRPSPSDTAAQAALAAEPGMLRAHELFDCDMADDAAAEWNAVLEGAAPARKVQAAILASRWGWYAQSITTLAQSGEFDDVMLRYPRPYLEAVAVAGRIAQLPPDWILAVMRQESLFRQDAVSRADARGLMQLLPPTAAAIARRWQLPPPARDSLFDPAIAIPLGAAYLRELLDRYGEQLALCLAAYNAGPGAVARWLPADMMDADVWIENIPYNETRAYVQHILEHIVAFAAVRGATPPRLGILLQTVEPQAPPG